MPNGTKFNPFTDPKFLIDKVREGFGVDDTYNLTGLVHSNGTYKFTTVPYPSSSQQASSVSAAGKLGLEGSWFAVIAAVALAVIA